MNFKLRSCKNWWTLNWDHVKIDELLNWDHVKIDEL
jgi:hypothetical protein